MRTNADDPPDVYAEVDGVKVGIELTEVLLENRLAKDDQFWGCAMKSWQRSTSMS